MISLSAALVAAILSSTLAPTPVNVIDGKDDRGALVQLGPKFGLTPSEITRIRAVFGNVACLDGQPRIGSAALFITNGQILSAAHIFFDGAKRETKCFFRAQNATAGWVPLVTDDVHARFGSATPRPGSNNDWAVVRLATPMAGAVPFPVDRSARVAGDKLIVVTAHPQGFDALDPAMPVVQACAVRRVPKSTEATSFYRSDCDASPGSSGGMHLFRGADGALSFRGMTISTGPSGGVLDGAPYDEKAGSVTTALGTDAAILKAGLELAGH
jgi:hypothetical protein